MFFRFELYPADLLNVINGKSDEDAGRIIRQWVIGLIGNNTECIHDDAAKALAEKMLGRCQEKSDIYRNNRKKAIEKAQEKKAEKVAKADEKKAVAKAKPQKHPLYGFTLVNVTDKEEQSLLASYGIALKRMAEVLHNYKEANGKKYASDAGAIRSWVADKVLKEEKGKRGFKAQERERDAVNASSMLTDEQKEYYGL